ncbi:hypothetical protein [Treponema sp.]|uniref:hypothetical protein n=1 Tax=Treponema sp. TaxID=166 RepID=UPI0025FB4EC7|nr:hypothetical protein [Treponema sp.]MCR5218797.1 hypothetical protein [Treponema sp.]
MEELRSTDILDKEIRTDSGKKAESIKEKALADARSIEEGLAERIALARKNAEDASSQRLELFEKNTQSSLPLEKQRYLVSYIYSSVIEGINSYFESAGENKRLQVIRNMAEKAKKVCGDKKMDALVYGFSLDSASKVLKELFGTSLGDISEGNPADLASEAVAGFNHREGVVLKARDLSLTCRLTLDQKVKELLESHNLELSQTLFGGRLPE